MDLTKMTRGELAQFQRDLARVATASDVLADGGNEIEISLTSERTVLCAPPILSHGTERAPVLVEPIEIEIEAPRPVVLDGPGSRTKPACEVRNTSPSPAAQSQMVMGPLSDSECGVIRDGLAKGETVKQIAAALNRRASTVALWIGVQEKRAAKAARKSSNQAGQPALKPAPIQAADPGPGRIPAAAEGMAEPVAQGAGGAAGLELEMPGGDQGGLQQHVLAGNTPLQVGEAAVRAAPSPTEVPEDLRGNDRVIWRALAELRPAPGWDIVTDLDICEAFGRGTKAAHIALDLGVDAAAIIARYKALTAVIRDDRGHMTIDGQSRFIELLRRRAAQAAP